MPFSLTIRRLFFAAAMIGAGPFALAAEPPGFGSNDAVQLKAKTALEKDPALQRLNLWVSVQDGVVVVNGSVPSEEMNGKIEAVLAKVPGVSVVRVTTWVVPAEDPIKKMVGDKLAGLVVVPTSDRAPSPALAVNPVLPGSVSRSLPALPEGIGTIPVADTRVSGTIVVQRIEPTSGGGLLEDPIVATNGSALLPEGFEVPPLPVGPVTYPTIRATRVPVAPAEPSAIDTALALLAVRKSDPRFAGLVAEVRGGSAVIKGLASSRPDAEAFADAVAKVAGVERVTVGQIKTP